MATHDTFYSKQMALKDLVSDRLAACAQTDLPALVGELFCQMIDSGFDAIPLPGHGASLARWRMLAAVATQDLSLAKLFEAHTDALAILAEAGADDPPHFSVWGVWCAEPPGAVLHVRPVAAEHRLILNGEKQWCSGAASVTHALISYRDDDNQSCLAAVDLDQEGIRVQEDEWKAVGMSATRTATLHLTDVHATPVGAPGFYLSRAGFWHGAIGIAACWFGAAAALADSLRQALHHRRDPHALAHLGQVECNLAAAAQCLRDAAHAIDDNPAADTARLALRTRLQVEAAAQSVLTHIGRALGPMPYCRSRHSARLLADLPVFLRQSHAERDLAHLGALCIDSEESPWQL